MVKMDTTLWDDADERGGRLLGIPSLVVLTSLLVVAFL